MLVNNVNMKLSSKVPLLDMLKEYMKKLSFHAPTATIMLLGLDSLKTHINAEHLILFYPTFLQTRVQFLLQSGGQLFVIFSF